MKPFNLERALAGDPVVTSDGSAVIEIFRIKANVEFPVIAVMEDVGYGHFMHQYSIEGYYKTCISHPYNLFMAPKKKTYWVNVYKHSQTPVLGVVFSDEEEAIDRKGEDYVKTISFELEDE